MTAQTVSREPELVARPVPEPRATLPARAAQPVEPAEPDVPEVVAAAERSYWRAMGVGIAIGVPACALVWMGLVALALAIADTGWPYLPALGMAAVVGAFAGSFFGGWAGVTVRAETLEAAEHEARTHRVTP